MVNKPICLWFSWGAFFVGLIVYFLIPREKRPPYGCTCMYMAHKQGRGLEFQEKQGPRCDGISLGGRMLARSLYTTVLHHTVNDHLTMSRHTHSTNHTYAHGHTNTTRVPLTGIRFILGRKVPEFYCPLNGIWLLIDLRTENLLNTLTIIERMHKTARLTQLFCIFL